MSIFPALIFAQREHTRFELPEPPGRGAAPRRFLALAAGVLLSLAGSWPAAAEAQTVRVGSAGVTLASGASARGATTLTAGDAVPGPRGAVTRDLHRSVEGDELLFVATRLSSIAPIPTVDTLCYYTVSETGDMVPDDEEGTKTTCWRQQALREFRCIRCRPWMTPSTSRTVW